VNADVTDQLGIPRSVVDEAAARERLELDRRDQRYRGGRPPLDVTGRTVILIDDGLATGATMEAAVLALRTQSPARIVVAVPVGAADTCQRLRTVADDVVCLETPEPFRAVGLWYEEFAQTTDEEVVNLLMW
jgi:predicted phosphoribosyltransferase